MSCEKSKLYGGKCMANGNGIRKIRTSNNGNDIYNIPIGNVEGVKTTFKSGSKGYRIFGKQIIGGKLYQVTGNLIEL